MAILRVKKGKQPGAVYGLQSSRQPVVIGRGEECEARLDDDRASRKHARVVRAYGSWIIQDLGSSNGTLVQGKPVERARLEDGLSIQIGNTLLQFEASPLPPPPEREVYGSRAVETIREESGVLVCRGLQIAMDREVRIDLTLPQRILDAESRRWLEAAWDAADRLRHDSIDDVIHVEPTPDGARWVIQRARSGVPLDRLLTSLGDEPLTNRYALFRELASAVLCRGAQTALSVPLEPAQVTVRVDDEGIAHASIHAVELPAYRSLRGGNLCHVPSYAPFLAPELAGGDPPDGTLAPATAVYGLGALGYRLLTGKAPVGEGAVRKTLENQRELVPTPASLLEPELPSAVSDLLEALLEKSPEDRPTSRDEILAILEAVDLGAAAPVRFAVADRPTARERPSRSESPQRRPAARQDTARQETGREGRRADTPEKPAHPAATGAPTITLRSATSEGRATKTRPSPTASAVKALVTLPLWVLVWGALFWGGRVLSKVLFDAFLRG